MEKINRPQMIVIHHSAGPDHAALNDWESIRAFHTRPESQGGRGWSQIGYHYGVELDRGQPVIRYGRKPWELGAHAPGYNDRSLGVCLIGDYSKSPPPAAALSLLTQLLAGLATAYGLGAAQIYGHKEIMTPGYTQCPGDGMPLDNIRRALSA